MSKDPIRPFGFNIGLNPTTTTTTTTSTPFSSAFSLTPASALNSTASTTTTCSYTFGQSLSNPTAEKSSTHNYFASVSSLNSTTATTTTTTTPYFNITEEISSTHNYSEYCGFNYGLETTTTVTTNTPYHLFYPRHQPAPCIPLQPVPLRLHPLRRLDVPLFNRIEKKTSAHNYSGLQLKLNQQWRKMEWTEERKINLMKSITFYTPGHQDVSQARVLLLGPVSSGKSSFISSVHSVFSGRVTNRAMVGSFPSGFTKKIQSFNISSEKGDSTGLVLCDVMGLREGQMTGLSLHDILSVIKGHVPDGHKFSPDQPVDPQTVGFIKRPSLKDRIHCVAFVVDAANISNYPNGLKNTFHQLRKYISDIGVHQVGLVTHVDQICPETCKDVSNVYKSTAVRDAMRKAAALVGMSTSSIVPVKNYSSELDVDLSTDVLLLSAVDHILQYANLYFQDSAPESSCVKVDKSY